MKIRIVSHAYAMQLPQYAVFLRCQLSSLLACQSDTVITVCYCPEDSKTVEVLEYFQPKLKDRLQAYPMPIGELGRRSIGRNRVALQSTEDLVWFADCDYFWKQRAFNRIHSKWRRMDPRPTMIYPRYVQMQKDQNVGDAFVSHKLGSVGEIYPDVSHFKGVRQNRSIGGIQIVSGDFAREYGYLNAYAKYQQPTETPFRCFRDDVKFRQICNKLGAVERINIPDVYRLRHNAITYPYPLGRNK